CGHPRLPSSSAALTCGAVPPSPVADGASGTAAAHRATAREYATLARRDQPAMLTHTRRNRHPCCMGENEVAQNATYQSADRVLALLKTFDDSRMELGVAEIARALDVHKSTASRLAAALERSGFLTRSGRRYRLGVEVIRLGTLALRSFDLVTTMQPAM